MQPEEYLLFFQQLFQHYYQFTLENPVYASCLALTVWLLTAIFYSIRIGLLNRRNDLLLKAGQELKTALTEAEQSFEQLEQDLAQKDELLAQESQRAGSLQERLQDVGAQLSTAITVLAADPDLGQQGLSVSPGLQAEDLWLRFNGAVKQLAETVKSERRSKADLQQALDVETGKTAEKDLQVQGMQLRIDDLNQQYARLEASVAEQKLLISAELANAQQALAVSRAGHQADQARLASLEVQLQAFKHSNNTQVGREPQPEIVAEPIAPSIAEPVQVQVVVEPKPVIPEPVAVPEVPPTPEPVVEPPAPQREESREEPVASVAVSVPAPAPVKAEKTGGGMFAKLKQRIDQLDEMMGQRTPKAEEFMEEPVVEPVKPIEEPIAPITGDAVKDAGLGGKLKGMFGKKAAVEPLPPAVVPEPVVEQVKQGSAVKNLFGKFSRKS